MTFINPAVIQFVAALLGGLEDTAVHYPSTLGCSLGSLVTAFIAHRGSQVPAEEALEEEVVINATKVSVLPARTVVALVQQQSNKGILHLALLIIIVFAGLVGAGFVLFKSKRSAKGDSGEVKEVCKSKLVCLCCKLLLTFGHWS